MRLFYICLLFVFATVTYSQQTFKDYFLDGDYYFISAHYDRAVESFEKAFELDTTHYNCAFKIGVCYSKTPNKIWKAIPYLELATGGLTGEYKNGTYKMREAPYDVYYHLGIAYQLTMQLDKAREAFSKYLTYVTDPEIQFPDVQRRIKSSQIAEYYYNNPKEVEIQNVGTGINTGFSEFNPCVPSDNSVMYFTREVIVEEDEGDYAEKMYRIMRSYSEIINGELIWEEAEDITEEFESEGDCYTISVSGDGKTLIMFRDVDVYEGEVGAERGELVISKYENARWTSFQSFPSEVHSEGEITHASISNDGQTMYFTSGNIFEEKSIDIYYTEKDENGKWGKAKSAGPVINSEYDEATPFLVNDTILFFSSKGHDNIGGFDVFRSVKDSTGAWTKPENMSIPINSPLDDIGFMPLDSGSQVYFSAERPDGYLTFGKKDIYNITILSKKAQTDTQEDTIVETEVADSLKTDTVALQVIEPEITPVPTDEPEQKTAVFETKKEVPAKKENGYQIQIFASNIPMDIEKKFPGVEAKEYFCQSGLYKYTTGVEYEGFTAAKNDLPSVREKGYKDAFIRKTESIEKDVLGFDYTKKYTVQILASVPKVSVKKKFPGLKNIAVYWDDQGIYRYFSGTFDTWIEAKKHLDELKTKGYDGYVFQLANLRFNKK